ncbi:MAG: serine hydrolase [Microvirga sp.]
MHASRALRSIAFVVGTIAAGGVSAATPALVVDVDSGKVLYAERATDPWFPASITKLMTTYVALSAVQEGKLSLDTLLRVSENAASQPPSKMAFRPGTEITLDNALKIIMVKSANDVAMVIAEGIGGSVEGFAKMMNDAAWRIGMRESRWVNPHGLPDPGQYTSARDMAVLGRALLRDFPEHRGLFQLSAIKFGRRVMANHNGLIGRYPGADGMKTGFICSSGFNVVASATRDGRRLITVILGSPSAGERTMRAADLFDRGFASFGWGGQSLEALPASASTSPPDMRPYICGGRGRMPSEEDAQPPLVDANAGRGTSGDNPISAAMAAPAFSALAFAGGSIPSGPRKLGPRAPLQPVLVWTGAAPGSNVADNEEPRPRLSRRGRRALAAKRQARPAAHAKADSPAAQAFASARPASIMDDGKAKPKAGVSPSAALAKPKHRALGAKTGAPVRTAAAGGAKAESKHSAKPAGKTSAQLKAKKPVRAKPAE